MSKNTFYLLLIFVNFGLMYGVVTIAENAIGFVISFVIAFTVAVINGTIAWYYFDKYLKRGK